MFLSFYTCLFVFVSLDPSAIVIYLVVWLKLSASFERSMKLSTAFHKIPLSLS